MKKKDNKNYYLTIISKIEKVRSKNNVNWMGLLRLAFKHAPKDASKLMKRVNSEDKKISSLLHKLSSKKNLSE
tara:strand:- start:204 stop:422 length:219 start_codon:yes stop_codon:yes gene_type:complete